MHTAPSIVTLAYSLSFWGRPSRPDPRESDDDVEGSVHSESSNDFSSLNTATNASAKGQLQEPASDYVIAETLPRRLNGYFQFLILSSTFTLWGAVAFITWLWWQPKPGHDVLWRRFVLNSYVTQAVTISSIFIRTAAGILAGVSCSMIASIALESHGVPLEAVADFSISRYSNSPSTTVLYWIFGSALDATLRTSAITLVLTTVASQFTSTLLVTDLRPGAVEAFPRDTLLPYGLSSTCEVIQPWSTVWDGKPLFSETFAEYVDSIDVPEDEEDTGPTFRAFIPLQLQDDRERLRGYKGMSGITESRVACIRPTISDVHFCTTSATDTTIRICGSIKLPRVPSGFMQQQDEVRSLEGSFMCAMPDSEFYRDSEPAFRQLSYGFEKAWQWCASKGDGLNLDYTSELAYQEAFEPLHGYLVWNYGHMLTRLAGLETYQRFETGGPFYSDRWLKLNSTGSGPWVNEWYRTPPSAFGVDVGLQLSYCYDTFGIFLPPHLNITASRNKTIAEPQYSMNATTGVYNATAVSQQLGAVREANKTKGGILTISVDEMKEEILKMRTLSQAFERLGALDVENPSPEVLELRRLTKPYREACQWGSVLGYSEQYSLCPDCPFIWNEDWVVPHARIGAIFYDTIQGTDSPALAVQAVKTTRMRYAYYNVLERFTMTDNASLTYLEEVLYPGAFHGYWAMVAIITTHLLLFFLLLHSFLNTRFSFLGSVWHTVAQISESAACVHILQQANLRRDTSIAARLAANMKSSEMGLLPGQSYTKKKASFWERVGGSQIRGKSRGLKIERYVIGKGGQLRAVE